MIPFKHNRWFFSNLHLWLPTGNSNYKGADRLASFTANATSFHPACSSLMSHASHTAGGPGGDRDLHTAQWRAVAPRQRRVRPGAVPAHHPASPAPAVACALRTPRSARLWGAGVAESRHTASQGRPPASQPPPAAAFRVYRLCTACQPPCTGCAVVLVVLPAGLTHRPAVSDRGDAPRRTWVAGAGALVPCGGSITHCGAPRISW